MARRYTLDVNQGEDFKRLVPVLDADDAPTNVNGWTAVGQIRGDHYSDTVLHTLALTPTGTNVEVSIPGSASAAWEWHAARYDIKLTNPSGTVTRLIQGNVIVRFQVTRV